MSPPPNLQIIAHVQKLMIEARSTDSISDLTMRKVRTAVCEALGASEKYMSTPAMKALVKQTVDAMILEFSDDTPATPNDEREPQQEQQEAELVPAPKPKPAAKKRKSTSATDADADVDGAKKVKKPRLSKKSVMFKSAETVEDSDEEGGGAVKEKEKKLDGKDNLAEKRPKATYNVVAEGSDSDTAMLVDGPASKKARKSTDSGTVRPKRTRKSAADPPSKDEERLKKMKQMVLACGKRCIWVKEFKGMEDSPSKQIKRVKEILGELGMTGRLSLEQAKAIKVKKEFEQELEEVVEFEKKHARSGKRSTRADGPGTSAKVQSEAEESSEDDAEDEAPVKSKKKNLRQSIMAFVDSESE